MKRLVLTPAAQNDLDGIYDYTFDEWGIDQAERYIDEIMDICDDLISGQKKGRDASLIRADYRSQLANSHVLFYKETTTEIAVMRILHQKQNFPDHLF